MPTVLFEPGGVRVEVAPGGSLWEAAKRAGIPVEAPCGGKGLCKKCLVKIESGEIEPGIALPSALTERGYALICRASVMGGDVCVRVLSDLSAELGQFLSSAGGDALIEPELLPSGDQICAPVRRIELTPPPPAEGSGLSDLDRLLAAARPAVGELSVPLPLLRQLPDAIRHGDSLTLSYHALSGAPAAISFGEGGLGIALDIGTTTLAAQLIELSSGRVLAEATEYNGQIAFGLDVISRINYAQRPERLVELSQSVLGTINALVASLLQRTGRGASADDVVCASVAGNTTMILLLLGIPPENLRLAPYCPAVYGAPVYQAREVGLAICPHAPVWIAPAVGSYVGGDITAGLLATRLSLDTDEVCLLLDIGTNGEMVLGNRDFLMGCACSAGPAFEGGGIARGMRASAGAIERVSIDDMGMPSVSVIGGGEPRGICGSGVISLVAELFRSGLLDASGKLDRSGACAAIELDGKTASYRMGDIAGGADIAVGENDIQNVIRAKAAIFSAMRLLLGSVGMGFDDLSRVYIAGGFGRYLDMDDAVAIGLLPNLPRQRFSFIGNASIFGARMALISETHRERIGACAGRITYVDLSAEPSYMHEYTAALFLPHTEASLFGG